MAALAHRLAESRRMSILASVRRHKRASHLRKRLVARLAGDKDTQAFERAFEHYMIQVIRRTAA